ncbi:DUF58 domain-containing protein [Crateriforma conspicua]|uniref:VWA domain containing CoxE-like protein n=1 Tax=Crateriforma conspicua TaxID=2527996 RepID=A0A5C5YBK5_9PLAN|nr:DUF58 domain-containing protein [Crateriforma conspicua]TWT71801.1 VWA domain containing CoxE-like protein [Crateriforma conspicua]
MNHRHGDAATGKTAGRPRGRLSTAASARGRPPLGFTPARYGIVCLLMSDAHQNRSLSPTAAVDPAAVMRIKNLQLRAKAVVEGFYNGLHRSPYHGFSVEFSEYRPYTVGDDTRGLDWKLFARTDRYFIKKFEDETNRRCYLVVDQSRSMGYGSLEYSKMEYARTIAASLAYFLTLQRDSVGLLTFDETIGEFLSARHRPGHLHQLMQCLSRDVTGKGTDIAAPLEQMATLIRKRGLIVLLSDLLTPPETMRTNLAYLRSRGHEVIVLRILDPRELRFDLDQAGMVRDPETDQAIYLDPEEVRQHYQQHFDQHRTQLQAVCDSLGVPLHQWSTDTPPDEALFSVITDQQRRRSPASRNNAIRTAARGVGLGGGNA